MEDFALENTEMEVESTESIPVVDGVVSPDVGSTIQETDTIAVLNDIYHDVHLILVFIILTFVMSCMRIWRKNAMKGV